MKEVSFLVCVLACVPILVTSEALGAIADGYAYLEGQENYADIKVKFLAVSPSAVTDSTYTDSAGYFSRNLVPGTYDVLYSKTGYMPFGWYDEGFVVDRTVNPITLPTAAPQVPDTVSGSLGPGRRFIVSNVVVPDSLSLTILPGTELLFTGHFNITVNGSLHAVGTEQDSITFGRAFAIEQSKWAGIRFDGADFASQLSYCRIEYGRAFSDDFMLQLGGGVFMNGSRHVQISHSSIQYCVAQSFGGGVCAWVSDSLTISDCVIMADSAGSGGGVFSSATPMRLTNTSIDSNQVGGDGGGVSCNLANPDLHSTFTSCTILANTAIGSGGGVFASGTLQLTGCRVNNNSAFNGGGIFFANGSGVMASCTLRANTVGAGNGGGMRSDWNSTWIITDCRISSNTAGMGGGLFLVSDCQCTITGSVVGGNSASEIGGGGGLHLHSSLPINISSTRITGNSAAYNGGGIALYETPCSLTQCTVSSNSTTQGGGAGIYIWNSAPVINTTSVTFSTGSGVFFDDAAESSVEYGDFFSNSFGDFVFVNGDPSQGPPFIGQRLVTNLNGDSADVYLNIFEDPLFVDRLNRDYNLLPGSACIDAGDPALPHDPDGTVADIGAYPFNQLAADPHEIVLPREFELYQNYPNPFNSTTEIRFDLPMLTHVELSVYNTLGQHVETLINAARPTGAYRVHWNGTGVVSGIYFYHLKAGSFIDVRKMILLR